MFVKPAAALTSRLSSPLTAVQIQTSPTHFKVTPPSDLPAPDPGLKPDQGFGSHATGGVLCWEGLDPPLSSCHAVVWCGLLKSMFWDFRGKMGQNMKK